MSTIVARLPLAAAPARQLRRLWRLGRVVTHIGMGFVLALWLGAWRDPHRARVRDAASGWLAQLLSILAVQVTVEGQPHRGPGLWVSNHVSWLDIPVLGSVVPVHFLSKAEVRDWPLIGALAAAAGTLFIRRGSGDSRQRVGEIAGHLGAGRPVLIFPEGTTTEGVSVGRFHPRLFEAASLAGVPVQPVSLRYGQDAPDTRLAFIGDDAFHSHLWQLLLRDHIEVRLTFLAPIDPAGLERDTLAGLARERVAGMLARF